MRRRMSALLLALAATSSLICGCQNAEAPVDASNAEALELAASRDALATDYQTAYMEMAKTAPDAKLLGI